MGLADIAIFLGLAITAVASVIFCIYGAHCFLMVWRHMRLKKTRLARDQEIIESWDLPDDQLPRVTIQLPLYNEKYVVSRLVEAMIRMDYPRDRMQIQILDDSTDETTQIARDLADRYSREGFDIALHHRTDRSGFKAGALKEGMKSASGEFIAIFDADFVPEADFLRNTLPFFTDSKIAAVQTLWGHLNRKFSILTLAQSVGLDGSNYVVQAARSWTGLILHFQGTGGVWRKQAIEDAGGWQADTLTEDLDLSFRAGLKGWSVKFMPQIICPAEIPATISAIKTQQHRWAKGGMQVAMKLLPSIWRSDLPPRSKFEASYHLMNYLIQPCMLIIMLGWPSQVAHRADIASVTANPVGIAIVFLCLVGPITLHMYALGQLYPKDRFRLDYFFLLMSLGGGFTVVTSKGTLEAVLGIKSAFVRTPKYRLESSGGSVRNKGYGTRLKAQTVFEVLFMLYCIAGVGFMVTADQPLINPFFILFVSGLTVITLRGIWESYAQNRAARQESANQNPPSAGQSGLSESTTI